MLRLGEVLKLQGYYKDDVDKHKALQKQRHYYQAKQQVSLVPLVANPRDRLGGTMWRNDWAISG